MQFSLDEMKRLLFWNEYAEEAHVEHNSSLKKEDDELRDKIEKMISSPVSGQENKVFRLESMLVKRGVCS